MWFIQKDDAIEVMANAPDSAITEFLVKAHPGATVLRSDEAADYNAFMSLARQTVEVQAPPVTVTIPNPDPETAEETPTIEALAPGPVTLEPAGNTWAIEAGPRAVVRDKAGLELLALELVQVHPAPVLEEVLEAPPDTPTP